MSHHISVSKWNEAIKKLKSIQVRTIEIQELKIFTKSHYRLSKISTNVSLPIFETLLKLDLYTCYTCETYDPGDLISFCHG